MKKQGSGYIVNTASSAAIVTSSEMGPYNATKATIVAMSETLYKEVKHLGIDISVVLPTVVKTNFGESQIGSSSTTDSVFAQVEGLPLVSLNGTVV